MDRTQTFQINDIAAFADILPRLSEHNPDFDLTKRELADKGLVGQRIYENIYPCEDVTLVPGTYRTAAPSKEDAETAPGEIPSANAETEAVPGEKPAAENETETGPGEKPAAEMEAETVPGGKVPAAGSEEENCLIVQVSGESVGYVRKASYPLLKELLDKGAITSLSLALHGGPYRMLFEDGTQEEGMAGFFGLLTATIREEDQRSGSSPREDSAISYISTSYDTLLLEQNGRRGNAALVLALILGAFYIGFSVPYWLMIRRGLIAPSPLLGGDLPNQLLNPHLGLVIAATVLTLLSLFMKNSVVPMLGALVFAGSSWTLPGYALFTAIPALLCAIAALRRKSGGFLTFLKVLALLAVLGVSGWLLQDTAISFWDSKTFMIRPTGTEAPPEESGYEGSDDEYAGLGDMNSPDDMYDGGYDENYDEGYDEDYGGDYDEAYDNGF